MNILNRYMISAEQVLRNFRLKENTLDKGQICLHIFGGHAVCAADFHIIFQPDVHKSHGDNMLHIFGSHPLFAPDIADTILP